MNPLSINIPVNFLAVCESTLARAEAAETEADRQAILSRQTVRGIKWAIEFVTGLDTECMSEDELNHAIRCTYYRGAKRPVFHN